MRRKIIPYNPKLRKYARKLRNKSTQSEIALWKNLKGKKVMGYDFHRQKPLDHFIADFYCYELKLVIELDGASHDFEDVQKKDARKQKRLESLGVTVIRFKDEEVFEDIGKVIGVIEAYAVGFEKRLRHF